MGKIDRRLRQSSKALPWWLSGVIFLAVLSMYFYVSRTYGYRWAPSAWAQSLSNSDQAAWVQAIGTLAALTIAIWFPMWHAGVIEKKKARSQIMRLIEMAQRAIIHIDHSKSACTGGDGALRSYFENEYDSTNLREVEAEYRSLQFDAMLDYRLIDPVRNFQKAIGEIADIMDGWFQDMEKNWEVTEGREDSFFTACEAAYDCMNKFIAIGNDYK